jgi:hypothetical protein
MMICLSIEQWEQIKRLSDFADFYIDDMEPSNLDYESDKEDILQAQEVIQAIDSAQYYRCLNNSGFPKFEPAEEEL